MSYDDCGRPLFTPPVRHAPILWLRSGEESRFKLEASG